MERQINSLSINDLLKWKKQFESIRDQAMGAIQAVDLILNDIQRKNEPEKKEEEAASPASADGNGYAAETA